MSQSPDTCHNCEKALPTCRSERPQFCPFCGQKIGPLRVTLRELCDEFLRALIQVDGKYVRSFRTLFAQPGKLTLDYFQGKRVAYLRPITLAMLAAGLFFFLSEWNTSETIEFTESQSGPQGMVNISLMPGFRLQLTNEQVSVLKNASEEQLEDFLDEVPLERRSFQRLIAKRAVGLLRENGMVDFRHRMAQYASRSVAILIPAMACLVVLLHRRKNRPYYAEAVIYCLHLHSFYFLCFCVVSLLPTQSSQDLGLTLLGCVFVGYTAISWRVAFACSWFLAFCKAASVLLVHMLFVGFFALGLALVTLAT